jgi:hypothetical protein
MNSCSQRLVTVTADFPTWWTGNTSIATASNTQINGVAVGTTDNDAQSINMYWGPKADSGGGDCPLSQEAPSAPTYVGPYRVEPISTTIQGAASCPAGQQGWSRTVQNQLQYANGAGYLVAGITMADILTIGGTNQLGISGTQTSSFQTDSNGSWPDTYYVCSRYCPSSGQTIELQTWTFNQIPLAHSNSLVYKCTSITIDGF